MPMCQEGSGIGGNRFATRCHSEHATPVFGHASSENDVRRAATPSTLRPYSGTHARRMILVIGSMPRTTMQHLLSYRANSCTHSESVIQSLRKLGFVGSNKTMVHGPNVTLRDAGALLVLRERVWLETSPRVGGPHKESSKGVVPSPALKPLLPKPSLMLLKPLLLPKLLKPLLMLDVSRFRVFPGGRGCARPTSTRVPSACL
mmetsp:Transcript_106271/g.343377  ORF Transcript_106271/g.343377 Transcript_106271/m.343377 type:complete len:203 (-) Transcript_106271:332-940(-)